MKRAKGCLGVFLVFFFGVLFGCAITAGLVHEKVLELVEGGPDKIIKEMVHRLNKDLKLDAEQQEMLEQIARDTRIELRRIRQSTQPEVDRTLSQAADRLRGILDPTQAEKFDRIIKKGQDKWRTRLTSTELPKAGEGQGTPPPPPPAKPAAETP